MELTLKNREWKEFVFEIFFNIDSTSSGIDRNKLIYKVGSVPYLTRSEKNNGYDSFICIQSGKYKIDKSNVITVGVDTQTVFYQPSKFYTGRNILVLKSNKLNKEIALFLIPLIKRQMEKFNWGNGATLTRLKRSKLLVPINSKDEPDYDFMEQYMRHKEQEKLKEYQGYIKSRLDELKNTPKVVALKEKEWGEFELESIFNINSGVGLTKADMKEGNKPFIGATDSNNGITEFVLNTNNSEDKNVLGLNCNGSVVENFYHPYTAIFSADVKRLTLKNIEGNEFLYLFMKTVVLKQKAKYSYGYKFNTVRMKKQKILLPITKNNEPDYVFMENYMKNLEYKKLSEYLEFKKNLSYFLVSLEEGTDINI